MSIYLNAVYMASSIQLSLRFLFFALLICGVQACSSGTQDIDLDAIPLELSVQRMDRDMAKAAEKYKSGPVDSVAIYKEFFALHKPFITDWMFMGHDEVATDSVLTVAMHLFMNDSHGRDLLDSVARRLGPEFDPKPELTSLFKRYKHHFPDRPTPVVVTYVDGYPPTAQQGIDQVFISPRFLGIGLHYFLGPDFKFYPPDLPKYIRRRCTPEHLPSVVAHKIAEVSVPEPDLTQSPVLVDHVIAAGIRMYVVDKLLGPTTPDSLKLFYTTTQQEWADYYEGMAFKDMIAELYSSDAATIRRYLDDSPFTSQLNRESAPRLGQFLGWKIVQKFMNDRRDLTTKDLVGRTDYQTIFKEAKYRPETRE